MTFAPNTDTSIPEEVLDPPAPSAAPYSIMSVAQRIPFNASMDMTRDGLPKSAIRLAHQRCVQAGTWPNCPPTFDETRDEDTMMDGPLTGDVGYPFFPVTGYVPVGCENSPTTRDTFAKWSRWATEDLEAATPSLVESFLWWKGSLPSVQGDRTVMPSLAAVAQTVGNPSELLNPRDGIARLIAARNDCNAAAGGAVLHVPDLLGPYLADRRVIAPVGKKMQTSTGIDVALGTGYNELIGPNNLGDGADDPTPDAAGGVWIYLSGPVYVTLGEPYLTADPTGSIVRSGRLPEGFTEPRTGEQMVVAARRAYYAFDTCCVYATKVRAVNVEAEVG